MSFLSVKDVTLQFGGVTAVDNVSFEVEEGEVAQLTIALEQMTDMGAKGW